MSPEPEPGPDGGKLAAHQNLVLPHSGWSLRIVRAFQGRPALEVHAGHRLIDVSVSTPIAQSILRGGRRGTSAGQPWSLAWGQVTDDNADIRVTFSTRRKAQSAPVVILAGSYWAAEVAGHFRTVSVSADSGRSTSRLLRP